MPLDTIKAIRTRYSCRAFSDKMPSDEHLRTIAETAVAAPSGMNRQLWRVIVVKNKQLLADLETDVLRAFLYTTHFIYGARSMESVLGMSRLTPGEELRLTDMPPKDQLKLHVDSNDFIRLLRQELHYAEFEGRVARFYAKEDAKKEKFL